MSIPKPAADDLAIDVIKYYWRAEYCGDKLATRFLRRCYHAEQDLAQCRADLLKAGERIEQQAALLAKRAEGTRIGCYLCGDQGPLLLRQRCHLTAPLQCVLDGDTLILKCYVPECGAEVARFTVFRGE